MVDKKLNKSTKIIRQYGIVDLKKYQAKIDKNIAVFKEAIAKERREKRRVQQMINSLEADIKAIDDQV